MSLTLQLALLPLIIAIAYATGWCLPHLWQDAIFWRTFGPDGIDRWWLRRHINNYRTLQWRHHLKHPSQPYPDLTT